MAAKRLLMLMRHAKSSWKDDGLDDHDRPLNKRGKRDAPKMGKLIREKRIVPELIITSSARRARKRNQAIHSPIVAPQQRAHTAIGKPSSTYDFDGVGQTYCESRPRASAPESATHGTPVV